MHHRLQTTFRLIAIWLTACLPLLRGHLPWRGDGVLHVYRLAHLQRAVVNGDFYPRWLPDLALGYGFPLFNYYAPLSYYVALPFTWISSPQTAIRISYILAICLTGFTVYKWSERVWQNRIAALLSSAIAVYSPYILYNVHERGAYAEAWGIAFIAANFCSVDALIRNPTRRNWLLTTLSVAGLLLIHNISALIAAPMLVIYVVATFRNRVSVFILVVSSALCGLGLATFFWLPALLEQNLVQIGRLTQDPALDFRNHFLTLSTLFALPQSADSTQVNPTISFGISLPASILACFSTRSFPRRRESILLLSLAIALTLITLPLAQPVWETLPLVSFIQFPWRLLGIISLLLAILAGGLFTTLSPSRANIMLAPILLYGLFWLFPARLQRPLDLSAAGSIQYELATGALGTTSSADYLPTAVKTIPPPTNRRLTTTSDAQIEETMHYLGTAAVISHSFDWVIEYEQFYFLGWEATLDGDPLTLFPAAERGLVSAEIPAGTHTLGLHWRSTPIRRTAEIISLLSAIIAIVLALRIKTTNIQSPLTVIKGHRGFVLVAVVIALTKTVILNNTNNLWHNPRFDGREVRDADFSADHNFQDALILRAYDLPSSPIPTDQPIPLTLYLQAATPIAFNPAISIHLVDEQGRFFGQSDQYRPANFPINRWQPNEYALDSHKLLPLELTPPGTYALRLFVLNDQTGARLNVLNAAGQPVGNHIDLGTVVLERGELNFFSLREWLGQSAEIALDMEGSLPSAQVGDTIPITLFWGAVSIAPQQQPTQFELRDEAGNLVAAQPFHPLNPEFPLTAMREAERWRDPQTFRVPPTDQQGEPLASGNYTLSVAIGETNISLRGLLNVTAPNRSFDIPPMQHSVNTTFDDAVTLLGYDLSAETLTLYWQAQREFVTGYKRFVHYLDADGMILAQDDAVPGRATTGWMSAEIITDTISHALPENATHLAIGLYDPQTTTRLADPLILSLGVE